MKQAKVQMIDRYPIRDSIYNLQDFDDPIRSEDIFIEYRPNYKKRILYLVVGVLLGFLFTKLL